MKDPDFGKLLDAAEAFDRERARWLIRHNKASTDFLWEVCRMKDVGDPDFVIGARTFDTARYERNEQASAAGMRAALSVINA